MSRFFRSKKPSSEAVPVELDSRSDSSNDSFVIMTRVLEPTEGQQPNELTTLPTEQSVEPDAPTDLSLPPALPTQGPPQDAALLTLQLQNTELREQIATLTMHLQHLSIDLEQHQTTTQSELQDLKADFESLETHHLTLQSQNTELKDEITNLTSRSQQACTDLGQYQRATQTEMQTLKGDIESLEAQCLTLSEVVLKGYEDMSEDIAELARLRGTGAGVCVGSDC